MDHEKARQCGNTSGPVMGGINLTSYPAAANDSQIRLPDGERQSNRRPDSMNDRTENAHGGNRERTEKNCQENKRALLLQFADTLEAAGALAREIANSEAMVTINVENASRVAYRAIRDNHGASALLLAGLGQTSPTQSDGCHQDLKDQN